MKICLIGLLALLHAAAWADTSRNSARHLVLFGGGTRPPEALAQFLRFAGGANSKILVVTWASAIPADVFSGIATDLKTAGATSVDSSLTPPKNDSEKRAFFTQLAQAEGVFFSGGDQNRTMLAMQDPDLENAFIQKYSQGFAFAGTSAGTAMMSHHMMTGDTTPLGIGLGLLPNVIMDTHFLKRHRNARLAAALAGFPDLLGVGVDEGTALAVVTSEGDSSAEHSKVVGPGQVVMITVQPALHEEYLQPGDCYDLGLKQRETCAANF